MQSGDIASLEQILAETSQPGPTGHGPSLKRASYLPDEMVQREPLPALPPLPPRTAAVTHLVGRNDTWTLGRKLGQGTFATVRLSQGKRTGCLAVVKTTPVGRKQRSRGRLFALREALVLSYLPRHESIPVLYDLVETEDAVHEVMQLAPGIELFEYVRRQPLGKVREDEARRIVAGILEALRHVHESGVLHRDVKVDNVFYEPTTGLITLLDYGLATFYDSATVLDEPWGCVK